jgi:hypothetical protein
MVRQKEKKEERDKYAVWKQNLPIMYDWILNHNLVWPSQSCRQALIVPHTAKGYISTLFANACMSGISILCVTDGASMSRTLNTRLGKSSTSLTGYVLPWPAWQHLVSRDHPLQPTELRVRHLTSFALQTDGTEPNKLSVWTVDVVKVSTVLSVLRHAFPLRLAAMTASGSLDHPSWPVNPPDIHHGTETLSIFSRCMSSAEDTQLEAVADTLRFAATSGRRGGSEV